MRLKLESESMNNEDENNEELDAKSMNIDNFFHEFTNAFDDNPREIKSLQSLEEKEKWEYICKQKSMEDESMDEDNEMNNYIQSEEYEESDAENTYEDREINNDIQSEEDEESDAENTDLKVNFMRYYKMKLEHLEEIL